MQPLLLTFRWADEKFDEKDFESAFMLYEGLVEHDLSGFSLYRLALLYHEGLGTERDVSKAEYLFSRAWGLLTSPNNTVNTATTTNNHEDPWAQFAMGKMCEMGYSVPQDRQKAEQYYIRSATLGHSGAQYSLGCLYMNGNALEKEKAVKYLQMAADQGHSDAKVQLGYMYLMGEGGLKGDRNKAFGLFLETAEKGNSMGQYRLATMYYYGKGVSEDKEEALKWYKASAEQSYARALNDLAWMYYDGKIVKKDVDEAYRLYKLAAEQDFVDAIYSLGLLTKGGEGVECDEAEAERLFSLAAAKGHVKAGQHAQGLSRSRSMNTTYNFL